MVVEGVWFEQVYDVESVCLACHCIRDSEVVPLGVSVGAVVRLQNQVIFKLIHLDCSPQVSRLKSGFKHQGLVVFEIRLVVWCENRIVVALTLIRLILLVVFFVFSLARLELFLRLLPRTWTLCILTFVEIFDARLLRFFDFANAVGFGVDVVPEQPLGGGVNAVIHNAVHQVFLVCDPLCFSPQAFFKYIFLWSVERLEILCI